MNNMRFHCIMFHVTHNGNFESDNLGKAEGHSDICREGYIRQTGLKQLT